MFARYARIEVAAISLGAAGLSAAAGWWLGWWGLAPAAAGLALLSFYRDPPRRIPYGDRHLVAPADGRVMRIDRDIALPELDGPALRIVIFLSVLNVHVNRAPCAGRVQRLEYRAGRFLNALSHAATEQNERNSIWLTPLAGVLPGTIVVRQIAGLLARRIVCTLKPGDDVAQGARFGMIKLGSQTDLIVPADPRWKVHVAVGDVVRGGSTILLSLEPAPATA